MKRMTAGRALVLTPLLVVWFAVVQMETHSPAQTNLRAGADERSPQVAVSPSVLDFGLVGVRRTKDLTVTVSNAGGGKLKGTATAASPFSVVGDAYALKAGQSKSLTVRYKPSAPGTNTGSILLSGGTPAQVLLTGWARMPPEPPGKLRVVTRYVTEYEVKQADFILHYWSDLTSYVLKPPVMDRTVGAQFYSIYGRADVLKLAAARPGRALALIAVTYFPDSAAEETVKLAWANDLQSLGYKEIIFCRGNPNKVDQIIGLEVLNGPQETKLSAVK